MAQYLSQQWLDEFVSLAADLPSRPGTTVRAQYKVTGGPAGDIDYYWVIDEGKIVEARLGTIDGVDFTMTNSYADGAAVQKGEIEPMAAFASGKVKVSGNMARMMALLPISSSPEWKTLQEKVQADTEY